ncbi:MAG: metalloregulator ArsR/SmtB family transcription factor [Candidatus Nitrosotenuis sp.]
MSMRYEKLKLKAKLFRGLGDSTRLTILELLRKKGERTASQIMEETGQSQSNVSNHLACLLECGLVKNRREGKNVFYSISDKKVAKVLEESDSILTDVADRIYACTHYNEK